MNGYFNIKNSKVEDVFEGLQSFFNNNLIRNQWIQGEHMKVYVRKSNRLIEKRLHKFLDIGSVEVFEQQQGTFTLFITELLSKYPHTNIFVESILNKNVTKVLKKFDFKTEHYQFVSNMYRIVDSTT